MSFEVSQERDAIPGRPLIKVTLVAIVVTVVAVWVAAYILGNAGARGHGSIITTKPMAEQEAVEQTLLERSGRASALRQGAAARLSSYGWVDETHRAARIPIARAIDLYVSTHADGGAP